ncbi:D-glucuronyl C5-epimerase family protein, partial [Escherichia coli]|nr:D-glucuronyl C5-epimerase family protein [Escherichia coli]
RARRLLAELRPLGAWRAGGRTWEYYFAFGGGPPVWASGMAQGTAVQVWARAARVFGDAGMRRLALSGLAIFRAAPPLGVRVGTARGAH